MLGRGGTTWWWDWDQDHRKKQQGRLRRWTTTTGTTTFQTKYILCLVVGSGRWVFKCNTQIMHPLHSHSNTRHCHIIFKITIMCSDARLPVSLILHLSNNNNSNVALMIINEWMEEKRNFFGLFVWWLALPLSLLLTQGDKHKSYVLTLVAICSKSHKSTQLSLHKLFHVNW